MQDCMIDPDQIVELNPSRDQTDDLNKIKKKLEKEAQKEYEKEADSLRKFRKQFFKDN